MKFYTLLMLVLFGIGISSPRSSHAAQDATIAVDSAAIRQEADHDSKILESKLAGSKVRISSSSKNGWYKTKTSLGLFGWIWQADVAIGDMKNAAQEQSLQIKSQPHDRRKEKQEPWLFLRAGGYLFGIFSSEISKSLGLGAGKVYYTPGANFELAARIDERLRLGVRLMSYSSTTSVGFADATAGRTYNYKITHSGTPLLIGLDADVIRGERFDVSAGLFGGFNFSNTLTLVASDFTEPNSFSFTKTTYALLFDLSAKYWFTRNFGLVGNLGFFYSRIPSSPITSAFGGDSQFRTSAGDLGSYSSTNMGPIIGLALQLAL